MFSSNPLESLDGTLTRCILRLEFRLVPSQNFTGPNWQKGLLLPLCPPQFLEFPSSRFDVRRGVSEEGRCTPGVLHSWINNEMSGKIARFQGSLLLSHGKLFYVSRLFYRVRGTVRNPAMANETWCQRRGICVDWEELERKFWMRSVAIAVYYFPWRLLWSSNYEKSPQSFVGWGEWSVEEDPRWIVFCNMRRSSNWASTYVILFLLFYGVHVMGKCLMLSEGRRGFSVVCGDANQIFVSTICGECFAGRVKLLVLFFYL